MRMPIAFRSILLTIWISTVFTSSLQVIHGNPSPNNAVVSGTELPPSSLENWGTLLVAVTGLIIRHRLREPSDLGSVPPLSPYQLALLSGGRPRLLQLVAAQLVRKGLVRVNTVKRTLEAVEQTGSDVSVVESQVFEVLQEGIQLDAIHRRMQSASNVRIPTSFEAIEESLVNYGLITEFDLQPFRDLCAGAVFFSALGLFISSILISLIGALQLDSWHLSVFREILLRCTASLCLHTLVFYGPISMIDWRTRWGDHVLEFYKTREIPDSEEAIALRGPAGMRGDKLRDLYALFEDIQSRDDNIGV
jgi:uncharacterized protein (TIGR04222 family)